MSVKGTGLAARGNVVAHTVEPLPGEIAELYGQIANGRAPGPGAPAALATRAAEATAEVVGRLLASAGTMGHRALAVAVQQPGLWELDPDRRAHTSLCDAARLAELTGLSVIDDFSSRDLASGGLGGPLLAVPLWMLLAERQASIVLLDLGRTLRLTYLPAREAAAIAGLLAFDLGPGMSLIDRLTAQLTDGEHAFDPGGRLAVQGRRIPGLVERWLDYPYFKRPIP
ncbi:MAG: anhydro-N-acetylmuramic acid kinase, partial [Pirellulales bacterium]